MVHGWSQEWLCYNFHTCDHMELDIRAAVETAMVICLLGVILCIGLGVRAIRSSNAISFYRIRHQRVSGGWRLAGLGILLGFLALFMNFYAEPVVYRFLPPSPSPSLTPSITLSPTITLTPTVTLTPTITLTPLVSDTPTLTPTPYMPIAVEAQFTSVVTPNPEAVFSPIQFSQRYVNFEAVNPSLEFQNPVGHLYGVFTYDKMLPGVQWTALWYRDGTLVHFETIPWDGATGGAGYTDWNPPAEEWLPGRYQVQIFVGLQWKVTGEFAVVGAPPPPTVTLTPVPSRTPTGQP